MDSIYTEINPSELIVTGNGWRERALVSPRPGTSGSRLIVLDASCPQGAMPFVGTKRSIQNEHQFDVNPFDSKQFVSTKQDPQDRIVMGGHYAADDTFGTRWGSRPGRPPE